MGHSHNRHRESASPARLQERRCAAPLAELSSLLITRHLNLHQPRRGGLCPDLHAGFRMVLKPASRTFLPTNREILAACRVEDRWLRWDHMAAPGLRGRMAFVVLSHVLTPDLVAGRQFVLNVNRESKYAVHDRLSTQRPGLGVDPVFAVQSNEAEGGEENDEDDEREASAFGAVIRIGMVISINPKTDFEPLIHANER